MIEHHSQTVFRAGEWFHPFPNYPRQPYAELGEEEPESSAKVFAAAIEGIGRVYPGTGRLKEDCIPKKTTEGLIFFDGFQATPISYQDQILQEQLAESRIVRLTPNDPHAPIPLVSLAVAIAWLRFPGVESLRYDRGRGWTYLETGQRFWDAVCVESKVVFDRIEMAFCNPNQKPES